jgi:hypothetical protein
MLLRRPSLRLWRAARDSGGLGASAGASSGPPPAADPAPMRAAMQALLADLRDLRADRLALVIGACGDVAGLWHLRAPLMQVLAEARGELHARRALQVVDALLLQAWPDAPVTRRRVPG